MTNKDNIEPHEDKGMLSFGLHLKKARLERGLSIDDVLNQTRISRYIIQQIEEEHLKNLPEDVFLKGFLKAFAETVGVDPDDILKRYKAFCAAQEGISEKNGDEYLQSSGISGKVIFCCILIALFILFTLIFFSSTQNDNNSSDLTVESEIVVSVPDGQVTSKDEKKTDVVIKEELLLELVCVEETGLKISTDGGMPSEYNLQPGDHLELKADTKYNILIDNTCGVTLFLNNEPVVVPGKCGQTVNIQLP